VKVGARIVAAWLALLCLGAGADQPHLRPTRDVDVTYALDTRGGPSLRERLRWDVAAEKLRIDPPTAGLYVIIDLKARRMSTVRAADQTVIEMAAPASAVGLPDSVAAGATRQGEDTVAGLACTEWVVTDAAGEPMTVCLTSDGVLLRARTATRTLLSATSVQYGPVDPAAYQVPADYAHHTLGAR
jgi:hypothetical protein